MTPPHLDLSIVIPAFNEAGRLPASLRRIASFLAATTLAWEVRVVDDGSTDETCAAVESEAARDPRIVLQREPHRGKGGAVRAGMLASTARLRFLCDADLSMPIDELDRFFRLVPESADVAIGSREGEGAQRIDEPARRHTLGRGFNSFVRAVAVRDIQDTQCGFKMFSGAAADTIFTHVTIDGWAFDVESLFLARRFGLRIAVVPITWRHDKNSRVSPFWDAIRMARDVIGIRWRAIRGHYPKPKT